MTGKGDDRLVEALADLVVGLILGTFCGCIALVAHKIDSRESVQGALLKIGIVIVFSAGMSARKHGGWRFIEQHAPKYIWATIVGYIVFLIFK